MSLSGQQRQKLQEALIDAFPEKSSLERMLSFQLDKKLDKIAGGANLEDVVFNLIKKAEAENWVENLISAACKSNPENQLLKNIAAELLSNDQPASATSPSSELLPKITQQQKILILEAIPHGLRLDKEIREIEEAIRRAAQRDLFEIRIKTAVRPQDIRRALQEEQPQIVHFCGHGMKDGSLLLEDEGGNDKPVSPEALASLFELHVNYVKCVLLNACYSEEPAMAISKYIDYVIGMNNPIKDKAAIAFAQGFYDGLGFKLSGNQDVFQRAFDEGVVAAKMENLSQGQIPVLKKKVSAKQKKDSLDEESLVSPGYRHIGEEICIDRRWECITFNHMRSREQTIRQHILAFQVPGGKGKSLLLKRFYYMCKVDASEGKPILYAKVDFRDRSLTADSFVSEILGTFIINAEETIQKLSSSTKFLAGRVTQLREAYEKIISQLNELDEEVENLAMRQTESEMSQPQQLKLARMFSNFCRLISEQWTIVLLLDTWEDSGKAGEWFLHDFIPKLAELDNVIAVLAGREGLSSLESRPDEVIFKTNLEPIKCPDDCQLWAKLKYGLKINEATAKQLIKKYQGDLQQIDIMLKTIKDFPDGFPLINL